MEQMPIGMTIKQIVHKKNLSTTKLAGKLGMSRQSIYNTYLRTSMHEGELEKWAEALEVTLDELNIQGSGSVERSGSSNTFIEDAMEKIQRLFMEELKEKNEQIRALQEALKESQQMSRDATKMSLEAQQFSRILLGKLREYPNLVVMPNQHGQASLAWVGR